jgi:Anti-sigma factor NepR
MYDEVVNEDVPDDFFSFLEQADENVETPKKKLTADGGESDEPAPEGRAEKTKP